MNKIRKWDCKPIQEESKRLKEAIQQAEQMTQNCDLEKERNLNDHILKSFVSKLQNYKSLDIKQILDSLTNDELIELIKMNFGVLLFDIHQMIKEQSVGLENKLDELIDALIYKIGFKSLKKVRLEEEILDEPLTKEVFASKDTPI
ncbi:hypothetical protein pb186bvf_013569 [Paramecium bursaria]